MTLERCYDDYRFLDCPMFTDWWLRDLVSDPETANLVHPYSMVFQSDCDRFVKHHVNEMCSYIPGVVL